MARRKKETPYNGGKWTKARMMSFIRAALRKASIKWPPLQAVMSSDRRVYEGPKIKGRNIKWQHQCNVCKGWFFGSEIERDHIVACGSLSDWEDMPGFARRLFCEASGVQKLCKRCHQMKHAREAGIERREATSADGND